MFKDQSRGSWLKRQRNKYKCIYTHTACTVCIHRHTHKRRINLPQDPWRYLTVRWYLGLPADSPRFLFLSWFSFSWPAVNNDSLVSYIKTPLQRQNIKTAFHHKTHELSRQPSDYHHTFSILTTTFSLFVMFMASNTSLYLPRPSFLTSW